MLVLLMQEFKIEHYENELPGNVFPEYNSLNAEECKVIIDEIKALVPDSANHENIFLAIEKSLSSKPCNDSDLGDIAVFFKSLDFGCDEQLYLIWYEHEIDKMDISSFTNHWENIWYPPSDELLICYCKSAGKLIMITDWGQVFHN